MGYLARTSVLASGQVYKHAAHSCAVRHGARLFRALGAFVCVQEQDKLMLYELALFGIVSAVLLLLSDQAISHGWLAWRVERWLWRCRRGRRRCLMRRRLAQGNLQRARLRLLERHRLPSETGAVRTVGAVDELDSIGRLLGIVVCHVGRPLRLLLLLLLLLCVRLHHNVYVVYVDVADMMERRLQVW